MKDQPSYKCRNCGSTFPHKFDYCANCGQKNTDGRITFSDLWAEFQDALFNIESKTWKTLAALFVPGKLTLEYFAGRHRKYVHPLRLLIVASLFTIIALSFQGVQTKTNHGFNIKDRIMENYERQRLFKIMSNITKSTNTIYPDSTTKVVTDTIMSVLWDSLVYLLPRYGDRYNDSIDLNAYVAFTSDNVEENISKHDFLNMSDDELMNKYKKGAGTFDRLMFRQKTKYIRDESKLSAAIVRRFTMSILLMMPFVALILYFLYRRRGYYYIENLIFSFHMHAFSFVLITAYILGWNFFPKWASYVILFITELYVFLSLLKVYNQSLFKTILKFIILNIAYCILFFIFLAGTFLVSFLLI